MKTNYNIVKFSDLQREEIRVRNRIRKQEIAIKEQFQIFPEEVIKAGVSNIIVSIVNGNLFRVGVLIVRTLSSVFSKDNNTTTADKSGIWEIVKRIVRSKAAN